MLCYAHIPAAVKVAEEPDVFVPEQVHCAAPISTVKELTIRVLPDADHSHEHPTMIVLAHATDVANPEVPLFIVVKEEVLSAVTTAPPWFPWLP